MKQSSFVPWRKIFRTFLESLVFKKLAFGLREKEDLLKSTSDLINMNLISRKILNKE